MESKKRFPAEFSVEELINSIEDINTEIGEVTYSSNILNFISIYKIESGTHIIASKLLFKLFKTWCNKSIEQVAFTNELTNHITHVIVNNKVFFTINKKSLDVSEKIIKHLSGKKRNVLKSKNYKIHYETFIKFYNLKQGQMWITGNALYYLYDKWTYKNKARNLMSYVNFSNYCKLYFNHRSGNMKHLMYFRVNYNILNHISKEKMKELEIARKRKLHVQGKDKKRKDKVPKSTA